LTQTEKRKDGGGMMKGVMWCLKIKSRGRRKEGEEKSKNKRDLGENTQDITP